MFVRTVIRQSEKIIDLNKCKKSLEKKNNELTKKNFNIIRENLFLTGALDDAQEEFLYILDGIEEILTNNNYGRADIKIRKALEEIRKQKDIIEKDINIELSDDCESK